MSSTDDMIDPWYRQFWPWFILALPASVVLASVVTLVLAMQHADSLVIDDYYKEGLGINRTLAQQQRAAKLAVQATFSVDAGVGDVVVALRADVSAMPTQLRMHWIHPTDKQRDFWVTLTHRGGQVYGGELPAPVHGRWYVHLANMESPRWRVSGEIVLNDIAQFVLSADEVH